MIVYPDLGYAKEIINHSIQNTRGEHAVSTLNSSDTYSDS
jgi:hypothetical protein